MKPQANILLALGLFGTPILAGCGGSSGSSSTPLITPQPRSISAKSANGLTVIFSENADAVSQVGSITYTVTLMNPTTQPITIQLGPCSGAPPDPKNPIDTVTITNAAGIRVYPAVIEGGGPPCNTLAPSVTQTLAPGQTLTDTGKLNAFSVSQLFSARGVYTLNAGVVTSSAAATTVGPLPLTVQ